MRTLFPHVLIRFASKHLNNRFPSAYREFAWSAFELLHFTALSMPCNVMGLLLCVFLVELTMVLPKVVPEAYDVLQGTKLMCEHC